MPILQSHNYKTMTEAIEHLQSEGFDHDFTQKGTHLECSQNNRKYDPSKFTITHTYRFEGMTNPSDNSVLYALETDDGIKGMLVDAYGVYADSLTPEMIEKFRVEYADPDDV